MSAIPHFVDSLFRDGGKTVSLKSGLPFTPRIPFTHFRSRLSRRHGHMRLEGLHQLEIQWHGDARRLNETSK
jgi:hypothetical protein